MKIAIFNVKFSRNLGDGLLSECLEAELRLQDVGIEPCSLDLAGREAYGEGLRNRRTALLLLEATPESVRRPLVRAVLGGIVSRTLRPRWRKALRGADAVVVGGGNIFSDADLNFPMKIGGALAEAARAGLPVGVFGVGVSDNWSARGRELFETALSGSQLVHAAVRDDRSRRIWDRNLIPVGVRGAGLCHDPALLASRHFPPAPRAGPRTRVGLGLTDPLALRYHAPAGGLSESVMAAWTVELVRILIARGWEVEVFTNGSPEDESYARRLNDRLLVAGMGKLAFAPSFRQPGDLAAFISGLDIVLAHRLHACIAAYSYGVPHVGFTWDPKLDSFFQSVGRADYVVAAGSGATEQVAALCAHALQEGVSESGRRARLDEAARGVASLYASLRAAVAPQWMAAAGAS
jgi:polysaccharide pyruvyl transferase WcaK-like protein